MRGETCTATAALLANGTPAWNDDALCTSDRSGLRLCGLLEDAPVPYQGPNLQNFV